MEQTEDDLPDGLPEGTVVVMPEAPPDEDDKGQVEKKLLQPPSSWSDDAMFNGSVASRSPPMERMRTPEQPAADEKGFSSSTPFGSVTPLLINFWVNNDLLLHAVECTVSLLRFYCFS